MFNIQNNSRPQHLELFRSH